MLVQTDKGSPRVILRNTHPQSYSDLPFAMLRRQPIMQISPLPCTSPVTSFPPSQHDGQQGNTEIITGIWTPIVYGAGINTMSLPQICHEQTREFSWVYLVLEAKTTVTALKEFMIQSILKRGPRCSLPRVTIVCKCVCMHGLHSGGWEYARTSWVSSSFQWANIAQHSFLDSLSQYENLKAD